MVGNSLAMTAFQQSCTRAADRCCAYAVLAVLKIFVANPNKTKPVMQLLAEEKERLIAYLDNLESKDGTAQDLLTE